MIFLRDFLKLAHHHFFQNISLDLVFRIRDRQELDLGDSQLENFCYLNGEYCGGTESGRYAAELLTE